MKIEEIKNTSKSISTKKSSNSSGINFADLLEDTDSLEPTTDINALLNLNPLFALQEFSDEFTKAKQYGDSLLKELNEMKLLIASSELSVQKLSELKSVIQNKKLEVTDIGLKNIIEDIELRAEIELLKYQIKGN